MATAANEKTVPQRRRSLTPRIEPRQERAKATVARILDTAAELIQSQGVEAFNTNRLAERCGVRVRSVYRYFPNKHAVVAALYRRMAEQWRPLFEQGFARMADPDLDWRAECEALGRAFLDLLEQTDGALAIRRAMKSEPTLVELERADNAQVAERFASIASTRVPGLPHAALARIGRTWLNTASILVDIAVEGPPGERDRQLDEALVLQTSYLANYFDRQPRKEGDER